MANPATRSAPGDVTAPAVPGAPVVVPYGRGLQISVVGYTPPSDFFRYRYFKNGVTWRESPTLSQIDFDVIYGTTYQYTVAALDTALPANVSAQSAIGSGVPVPIDTPDIKVEAVSSMNFQVLLSVGQTRNATQPAVPITGLSVSRNVLGSNGVIVSFLGVWAVTNGSALIATCGVNATLVRDGATVISGSVFNWTLATTPGPGNSGQMTLTINCVDFPGAGVHAYTVNWNTQSSNTVTTVFATCQDVALELVELKR